MELGVSSACFYPSTTEDSLVKAGELGFRKAELFLNSPSEIKDDFISLFKKIKSEYGIDIVSVHPFQSLAESFYLFSSYRRRYDDCLPLYEKLLEFSSEMGAEIFVIHGSKIPGSLSDEEYFERFAELTQIGKSFGVHVCQENVVRHRGESPDYLKRMREYIGSDFGAVLDIKQARRAGHDYREYLTALPDSIRHIHISDRNDEKDCIAPLAGDFDFKTFFTDMKNYGYNGNFIIELYNWSFSDNAEIVNAKTGLEKIMNEI